MRHIGRVPLAGFAMCTSNDQKATGGTPEDTDAQLFRVAVGDRVGYLYGPAHGVVEVEEDTAPAAR
ncbi:hypothetical protein B446_29035 [Streptomyces collinus Tu 365]|uniref:Uncharacterized protein n=1 Tax=Streptomyces collinus (strain DSM 40733 / Tue 365) TaxID=1214242 RepID=S5UZ60_STRC3|nr:hypothetical protein B446_29035 [Streptomyces collinus Tu 365]